MSFRESINNLIRSDRPESPTNLMFIVTILFIIAWETYAVLTKTTVPDMVVLAGFAFAIKVSKQVTEMKGKPNGAETDQSGSQAA